MPVHVGRLNRCSRHPPPSPAAQTHRCLHHNPQPHLPESDFVAKPQVPGSVSEVQKVPPRHFKKAINIVY